MQKLADAYSSIPNDHLGLFIAITALIGGMTLAGVIVCRGMTVQARVAVARVDLVKQMLDTGLSTTEIMSVLDHPALAPLTAHQRAHSQTLCDAIQEGPSRGLGHRPSKPATPAKPAKLQVG